MSMPAESTPISNAEQMRNDQRAVLSLLSQNGQWREITSDKFTYIDRLELSLYREQAFSLRLDSIAQQLHQLASFEEFIKDDSEALQGISVTRNILKDELTDVFKARYPAESEDLKHRPQENQKKLMHLNRDVNAMINFFVSQGEVESLSVDVIPELSLLQEKTLIELKIEALMAKLQRYESWHDQWDAANRDPMGLKAGGTPDSPLESVTKLMKAHTLTQISKLAERLEELERTQVI